MAGSAASSRSCPGRFRTRGERTAKYNRLLRIEEELGEQARYPGGAAIQRGAT